VAATPFARERVSQIFVPDAPALARNVGSGYFVDARRVLTAAHVVGALGSRARVRPLGRPDSLQAEVSWRDGDRDLAVLELTGDGASGADWERATFGVVEGDDRIPCRAIGFPDAQAHRSDEGQLVRDTEAIQGQIDPLTGVKATSRLTVHIEGSVPLDPRDGQGTPWAGISGAALFCGQVLVGVLLVDPARFERRLIATGLADVANDAELVAALGLRDAPALVPVRADAPRRHADVREPSLDAPLVRIPFARSPTFTGRDAQLADLEATPAGQARALVGMAGAGKSQLAVECAYRSLERRSVALVWWLRADDAAMLVAGVAELARHLGLAEDETPHPVAADAALRWLRVTRVPWLVVYDNAPEPDAVAERLAGGQAGRVLVTSRRRGWAGLALETQVEAFDLPTAARFLLDAAPGSDPVGAAAVAERLGGLPLALGQAVAYLAQTGRSFEEYLARLQEGTELLARPAGDTADAGTAAAVLAESRAAVQAVEPAATGLLDVVAYLDSQHVPLSLLEEHDDLPGFEPSELDRAVAALATYSLIHVEVGGFAVHRLVQEVTRAQQADQRPAAVALGLIRARFPADSDDPLTWPACAALLPHVLALADHAPDAADAEGTAWLLDRAATYIQYRGDARDATPHFERALAVCRTWFGDEHPITFVVRSNLAAALSAQGDLAGARAHQERLLEAAEHLFGALDPRTLTVTLNLAATLVAEDDLPAARALQERALDAAQRTYDLENVLAVMNNLALTLRQQGDLAGARQMQEGVLGGRRELRGDDDAETLRSMVNLATTLKQQDELGAARALEEEALAGMRRVLGEEHPDTLACMNDLATTLQLQGDLERARDLLASVREAQRRVLSDAHPDVRTVTANLQAIRDELGETDDGDDVVDEDHA
jgi:tetratricopeptide (TPR) repeat protein